MSVKYVYRVRRICIHEEHFLFSWSDTLTSLGNNLTNAVRFRQRQVYTSYSKKSSEITENEKEVLDEIKDTNGCEKPSISSMTSSFIEKVMRHTNNLDFFAKGLPRQSAQHTIMQCVQDFDNYFSALESYKKDPSKFTGKPELPGYKRKGGHCTVHITNQDCTTTKKEDGNLYMGLPFAKKHPLNIGYIEGRLKDVTVTPDNGAYIIAFVFEQEIEEEPVSEKYERIASIDLGLSNLMAVTNNCGLPCTLYKGNIPKSINQGYNKTLAKIMSEEMSKPDCKKTKDDKPKFTPTPESQALTLHRNFSIRDFFFKTAAHFTAWCVDNRIDTVVIGVNKNWKQESNLGKTNNQNFVQMPFLLLRSMLKYKLEALGIKYIEQEESYTSKASFLDNDFIPTYGKEEDEKPKFSGKRAPTRYKGMYKKNGFRGLYQTKEGIIINSDLNGSANILRKAIPDAFNETNIPDFSNTIVIKNPDLENIISNKRNQNNKKTVISKSKARRLKKKIAS